MKRSPWFALVCLALAGTSARAQVTLQWQFRAHETLLVECEATRKQTVTIKGKVRVQRHRKTSVIALDLQAKVPAGFVLDIRYRSLKFGVIPQDPDGSRKAPVARATLVDNVGGLTATVTARGQLRKLEGYDGFITALTKKNPSQDKAFKALLSEDAVRADLEDIFGELPERPVRLGDKWKHETSEPMPPFGSLPTTADYVLAKEKGTVWTLGCVIKLAYKAPRRDGDFLRVVKGSLTKGEGTCTRVFDASAGRPVRGEKAIQVRGELIVEALGKQTPLEFTSDNTWRMRTFVQEEGKR